MIEAGGRDGHPAGASLRRRAHRAQRPRSHRLAAAEARLYSNLITAAVTLEARPARGSRQARARPRADLVSGRRRDNAERIGAYPGATQKKLEVARWVTEMGLPLTINAPIHRQNIHNVGRYIDACRRARRAAARNRACAILRLGLTQPRGADPDLRADRASRSRSSSARESGSGRARRSTWVVPDYYAKRPKPCMGGWGEGLHQRHARGQGAPLPRGRNHPAPQVRQCARASFARYLAELRCFNAFRGTDWMKEPCRSCDLPRDRFRRLPVPGHGDHRRSAQHRSRLRALALSRGRWWRSPRPRPRRPRRSSSIATRATAAHAVAKPAGPAPLVPAE